MEEGKGGRGDGGRGEGGKEGRAEGGYKPQRGERCIISPN